MVTVVGIGAAGWSGLDDAAQELIRRAPLVIGGHREQTRLPDVPDQDRRRWPTPLLPSLESLLAEYRDQSILIVTTGDPSAGIGAMLVQLLGAAAVHVVPPAAAR